MGTQTLTPSERIDHNIQRLRDEQDKVDSSPLHGWAWPIEFSVETVLEGKVHRLVGFVDISHNSDEKYWNQYNSLNVEWVRAHYSGLKRAWYARVSICRGSVESSSGATSEYERGQRMATMFAAAQTMLNLGFADLEATDKDLRSKMDEMAEQAAINARAVFALLEAPKG